MKIRVFHMFLLYQEKLSVVWHHLYNLAENIVHWGRASESRKKDFHVYLLERDMLILAQNQFLRNHFEISHWEIKQKYESFWEENKKKKY